MRRQIYTLILILGVMLLFPLSGTAATKGIRIVPRSAWVKNDSLHLSILMDLEDVQVNTYTAVTFTPVLKNKQSTLELPAVILTGGSRHRFDRREQALQTNKSRQAVPFLTIIENRHTAGSKKVDYLVTVPYAAWMQQSSLLLRQDLKDCFRMRLKGIPALYSFNGSEANPVPSGDGTYSLPYIGNKIAYHETRAAMNYEGEVIGEFVTFRYTSSTHQLWSLWRDGEQIVKDIDLNLFFNKLPMDMDTNMEQEFDLLVTVYENKIVVTQTTASDWDEGGAIG